ncbi:MAG: GGDEF domain-containing protein [Deferribacterales bacterium]|nr:GGDEF domain-containing protein [Deferribacterales bacterium]
MDHKEYSSIVMELSDSLYYICDIETNEMYYMNKRGMDLCGFSSHDDYQGQKCYKIIHGYDAPCDFCINYMLEKNINQRHEQFNNKFKRWFEHHSTLIDINGRKCRLEISNDITDRKKHLVTSETSMEDILYYCLHTIANEKDFSAAVNMILDAIGTYYGADRAYIVEFDFVKQQCSNTYEWCAQGITAEIDNLQNLPLDLVDDWIRLFESNGEFAADLNDSTISHDSETYRILKAQNIHSLITAPLKFGNIIYGFIGVDNPGRKAINLPLLREIAEFIQHGLEKYRLTVKLESVRKVDTLTGLKSRRQYTADINDLVNVDYKSAGIIIIDINGMKAINDNHGHKYGDLIIKKVADTINAFMPNVCYRTGGDEFTILCIDFSKEDFYLKAVQLRKELENNNEYSISMGYSWASSGEDVTMQNLLHHAEEIRRAEKQQYYKSVLNEGRNVSFAGYVNEVMAELDEKKFVVFYQPQVDLKTRKIIGAEALVRKIGPNGEFISPIKFIPFYEMSGVIRYVDLFVLSTACETLQHWQKKGYNLHISVNMSRMTLLEPDIADIIKNICAEYDVNPSSIIIEVTESVSKIDSKVLQELFFNLKEAGFTISLDDFGSQYSNMAILSAVNFGEVKFDRTLVMNLEENHKSRAIIKNSIQLCKELQDTVSLAEGIETKEQLNILSEYNCDYGQGYYFSKPIPLDEFDQLMDKHNFA